MADPMVPYTDISAFRQIGQSGLTRFGGFVYEERNPKLQGRQGMQQYKTMADDDAVVGAMLYAIEQILRTTSWDVQAGGSARADLQKADFLKECMTDTTHTWSDFISEVLSMLVFGWAYTETIFKRRLGDNRDPRLRSRYNDGRIGWRAHAIRSQTTMYKWDFTEYGEINGWFQLAAPTFQETFLPSAKGLHFRTKLAKNNPEGRSCLRTAWRSWYMKRNLEEVEAIGIERHLVGIPVMRVPANIMSDSATADEKAIFAQCQKIVKNLRVDEEAGLILPIDPTNPNAYTVELLSHNGRSSVTDAVATPITRYSQQIAMSVLADVILLGHGQVGSFALASSKTDLFGYALTAFMDAIQQVLNHDAVPRLFQLNTFPETKELPRFVHGSVQAPDLNELGNYVGKLAGAGMPLFPSADGTLEKDLLRIAGLPQPVTEQTVMDPNVSPGTLKAPNIEGATDTGAVMAKLEALERKVKSGELAYA